jgi:hypothetical protein
MVTKTERNGARRGESVQCGMWREVVAATTRDRLAAFQPEEMKTGSGAGCSPLPIFHGERARVRGKNLRCGVWLPLTSCRRHGRQRHDEVMHHIVGRAYGPFPVAPAHPAQSASARLHA